MKMVGVLLALVVVAAFVINMTVLREVTRDQGKSLLMAYSEEGKDKILVHLAVTMGMYRKDPPRFSPTGASLDREWVDAHFQLYDASGNRVPIEKWGSDSLIDQSKAALAPELYLVAILDKGKEYVYEYVPDIRKPEKYRHEFSAPQDGQDPWHGKFVLVDE